MIRWTLNRSSLRGKLALLGAGLLFSGSPAGVAAQPERVQAQAAEHAVVELWEALLPLGSVNSFMNTGAHPDDERSGLLAYLSRGEGAHVISVTANRGEGGQNAIGTEYESALGALRSREMEEASRAFGVDLYFLSEGAGDPIYDFGFSKTPEEALSIWGEDETLRRLVRVVRESRPDVVFTSFLDVYGQHGHHRAMNRATRRAFDLAADPTAFPEQLEAGLRPWRIKKFYLPAESGAGSTYADAEPPPLVTLSVDTGAYDPIFGATYEQLGEQSRVYHQSQGMGSWHPEEAATADLHLLRSRVNRAATDTTVFSGLPNTVGDLAETVADRALAGTLRAAQDHIDAALDSYPNYVAVAGSVQGALTEVRAARSRLPEIAAMSAAQRYDLEFRLNLKEQQLLAASTHAGLLIVRLEVTEPGDDEPSDDEPENLYTLTPGGSTSLTLTAYRGGEVTLSDVSLELVVPEGWTATREDDGGSGSLRQGETLSATYTVSAPEDAPFTNPYRVHASPYSPNSAVYGVVRYRLNGVDMTAEVAPEERVAVLPALSLEAAEPRMIYNTADTANPGGFEVAVTATNNLAGGAETALSLNAPEGWSVLPQTAPLRFAGAGEVQGASFTVTPPAELEAGGYTLELEADGEAGAARGAVTQRVETISYPHVGDNFLSVPAVVEVQAFPVEVPSELRVGYIDGGSDTVYESLRQLGLGVELLDEETVTSGDLSVYDTILVGIYAYAARPDLAASNARLLRYVREGGNLVVQYHRPSDNWNPDTTAPFPLELGSPSFSWRVTDEASEVTYLAPENPLLNTPNAITPADWEGWVKDRALYIPMAWADAYTPLVSIQDPGETPFEGSLLTAEVGTGRYTYSSLIYYYQLDNLVPGAFRMMANLVTPPR